MDTGRVLLAGMAGKGNLIFQRVGNIIKIQFYDALFKKRC
jgi:hypothetical protein